jgi:hypothetical protein
MLQSTTAICYSQLPPYRHTALPPYRPTARTPMPYATGNYRPHCYPVDSSAMLQDPPPPPSPSLILPLFLGTDQWLEGRGMDLCRMRLCRLSSSVNKTSCSTASRSLPFLACLSSLTSLSLSHAHTHKSLCLSLSSVSLNVSLSHVSLFLSLSSVSLCRSLSSPSLTRVSGTCSLAQLWYLLSRSTRLLSLAQESHLNPKPKPSLTLSSIILAQLNGIKVPAFEPSTVNPKP